jgi:hypothetical protein
MRIGHCAPLVLARLHLSVWLRDRRPRYFLHSSVNSF